jgi:hypothetical protein
MHNAHSACEHMVLGSKDSSTYYRDNVADAV